MKQPLSIIMSGPERDLRPEGVSLYSLALALGLMLFSGPLWAQPPRGETFRPAIPAPPPPPSTVEPSRPAPQRNSEACCHQTMTPPITSETHAGISPRTTYTSQSPSTSATSSSYSPTPGFHYQLWAVGNVLPRAYWARGYWVENYWMFALRTPPWECVWVRYGNDALLVNRRNGAIVQILRHTFR